MGNSNPSQQSKNHSQQHHSQPSKNHSQPSKNHSQCQNGNCSVHGKFQQPQSPQQSQYQPPQFYQIEEIKGKDEMEMEENKAIIYKNILNYYGTDFIFTKVDNSRLNGKAYSIYYAKLDCMLLCNDLRYIIIIVPYDMMVSGNESKLSELKWVSFQTITFNQDPEFKVKRLNEFGEYLVNLNLKGQGYNVNTNEFVKSIIEIEHRKDDKSIYIVKKYPMLQVALFITNKKNSSKNEFADRTTLAAALDTFNCVLSFV